MNPDPPQLEYAPKPTWHRRRWTRRLLFSLTLLFLVTVLGLLGLRFRLNVQRYFAQRACLLYAAAPDQIVYEEDPTVLQTLTAGALFGPGWATLTSQKTGSAPPQLESYYTVPVPLNEYWKAGADGVERAAAFVHARDAGAGPRLVIVAIDCRARLEAQLKYGPGTPLLTAQVLRPAGILSTPEVLRTTPLHLPELLSAPRGALRLYAGQPDPNDASHFTIDFVTPTTKGTIDAHLQSDDSIKYTFRSNPPSTNP